jgi:hypothetical protein
MTPSAVKQYCNISTSQVSRGEESTFISGQRSFDPFILELYRSLKIDYPKFHKMDRLSKLGFLAAEVLLGDRSVLTGIDPGRTGVILGNQSSSLDTDLRYASQLDGGIPSPAVFVYTLPNIVIGEICIRHGLKGENTFFVSREYDIAAQVSYISQLFEKNKLDACIGGWVELLGEKYEAFLYLITRDGRQDRIDTKAIEELYHKKAATHAGVN